MKNISQEAESVEVSQAISQQAFTSVHDWVMARAEASLVRRNINFLLKPYKAKAAADADVIRLSEERKTLNDQISKAKAPYFEPMAADVVKGTTTKVADAVAALQSELKGLSAKRQAAEKTFESLVAEQAGK